MNLTWAHSVERSPVLATQFPESANASGLQEPDVWFLLNLIDQEYSSSIANPSEPWTSGFNWKQSYIGAGSLSDGQNFKVMLWGGLVRARFMTFGALAAVVCHEIGHRLGGSPHQKFPGQDKEDWSSSEGQSDFFAATRCLPRVYDRLKELSSAFLEKSSEETSVIGLCRSARDPQKCQWVATSGIDMIETLQVYYDLDVPFADPRRWAPEKVTSTLINNYPSYQCRMDIFKSGARDPEAPRLPCWFK